MAKYFRAAKTLYGWDKPAKIRAMIKDKGGLYATLKHVYVNDDLRIGQKVGEDVNGNSFYENNEYFVPRNRWCVFNKRVWLDYDATQIEPDWLRWLHHTTDTPPTKASQDAKRPIFQMRHVENLSGTTQAYVPYSTTKTKIEAWTPPSAAAAPQKK